MHRALTITVVLVAASSGPQVLAQGSSSKAEAPLVLTGAIPLTDVKGRIDHFALDAEHNRLFISALGNNTEEVIGLSTQTVEHVISGVPVPQGVAYAPQANKIFVGSDEGKLYIYDANTFELITSLDFGDDVDNLRYDPSSRHVYVGYGDEKTGAIGIVDATTNRRVGEDFKLGAHPESFQLEKSGSRIFVNVPDLHQIAVIDQKTGVIKKWSLTLGGNFPMALDEEHHRVLVATRMPARMSVFDTDTGHMIVSLPCVQDSDDLYYDAARKRVYVSGGEGYISVFRQNDPDHYQLLEKVSSSLGARTSGYFGKGKKGFDRFYVAAPSRAGHGAEVLIYTVQD